MTPAADHPWGWVGAEKPPRDFTPIWVTSGSYLIPLHSGAVLHWLYDETEELTYSMLVRLTEDEAQQVFDADPMTGMLEAIRPTLHWRGSLLTISHDYGEPYPMWRYRIQSDTTEDQFVEDLMTPPFAIVEQAVMSAESRRASMTDEQRSDYEFAAPMLRMVAA